MEAAEAHSPADVANHVKVAGQEFDLGALLGVQGLQEMLRSVAGSLVAMQQGSEALRLELEAVKVAGVARDEAVQAALATKASEIAIAGLLATIEAEKATRVAETAAAGEKQAAEATDLQQQLERLDDEFSDVRRSISKKVDKSALDDLQGQMATFASRATVSDIETRLAARIETLGSASTEWSSRQDAAQQSHTLRLQEVEMQLPGFQLVDAADRERCKLEEAGRTSAAAAGDRHAALAETVEKLALEAKTRFAEGERLRDLQGQAIQRLDGVLETKANAQSTRSDVVGVLKELDLSKRDAAAALAKVEAEATGSLRAAEATLLSHGAELEAVQSELATKALLADLAPIRDELSLCAREQATRGRLDASEREARDRVDALREDVATRVRALKARLDKTDGELARQAEAAEPVDLDARDAELRALIASKADGEAAAQWLESSARHDAELQAVHARTQTLGQGVKVALGWLEGMATKVAGVEGVAAHVQGEMVVVRRDMDIATASAQAVASHMKALVAARGTSWQPLSGVFQATSPRLKKAAPRGRPLQEAHGATPTPPPQPRSAPARGEAWGATSPQSHPSSQPQLQRRRPPQGEAAERAQFGVAVTALRLDLDDGGADEARGAEQGGEHWGAAAKGGTPRPAETPRDVPAAPGAFETPSGPSAEAAYSPASAPPRDQKAAAAIAAALYDEAPEAVLSSGLDLVVIKGGSPDGRPAGRAPWHTAVEDTEGPCAWEGSSSDLVVQSRVQSRPSTARARPASPERREVDLAHVGLATAGMVQGAGAGKPARPASAAPRTESNRRKAELEAKRRVLVETRLRPQSSEPSPRADTGARLTDRLSEL